MAAICQSFGSEAVVDISSSGLSIKEAPTATRLCSLVLSKRVPRTSESCHRAKRSRDLRNQQHEGHADAHEPIIFFKGNSDPFGITAVQITPYVNGLMLYTRDVHIPSAYLDHSRFKEPAGLIARCWKGIVGLVQNEAGFCSHLALVAGAMAGRQPTKFRVCEALLYKGRSMAALRKQLCTKTNVSRSEIFQTILRLFRAEILVEDEATAKIHLRMLQHIVQTAGGFAKLGGWLTGMAVFADIYFSCMFLSRPHFDRADWAPGPLSIEWKSKLRAGMEHTAVKPKIYPGIAADALIDIFEDLRDLARLVEYLTTYDVSPNDNIFRWKQLQKSDCDARLVHLYLDMISRSKSANQTHQTAPFICLAAIYWSDMIFGHRGCLTVGTRLLQQLKAEIVREETSDSHDEGDGQAQALLWALFVGAYAEEKASTTGEVGRWHTIRFFVQAAKMKLRGVGQIRAVLECFLYSDKFQGPTLRTLEENFGRPTGVAT
jgi:hypothetical protein